MVCKMFAAKLHDLSKFVCKNPMRMRQMLLMEAPHVYMHLHIGQKSLVEPLIMKSKVVVQ